MTYHTYKYATYVFIHTQNVRVELGESAILHLYRRFRQTFFGTSSENIDLKKIVDQLLCMIRVYSLLVHNFCSFSKLTILQWLSQSSYSNTCKNPVIHTSEYVGRTKMHGKFFLKPRKAVLGYLRTWQKNRTKKEAFPPKIYHFEV